MLSYEYYVLRVDLEATIPRVWRLIVVSPFAKLGGLHHVLAAAMGWDDGLPHHFVLGGDIHRRVRPGEILDAKRERNWRLDSAFYPDDHFFYVTGRSDEWRHRVTYERPIAIPADWRCPRCMGGDGACLPGAKKPFTVASANRRIWKAVPKR
jgi:Plasmid pRiA4b ORF-3-like protein